MVYVRCWNIVNHQFMLLFYSRFYHFKSTGMKQFWIFVSSASMRSSEQLCHWTVSYRESESAFAPFWAGFTTRQANRNRTGARARGQATASEEEGAGAGALRHASVLIRHASYGLIVTSKLFSSYWSACSKWKIWNRYLLKLKCMSSDRQHVGRLVQNFDFSIIVQSGVRW